jgi:hypothetical protein
MPDVTYKCPACDADLPPGARFCPNCGFVLAENTGTLPPAVTTARLDDAPGSNGHPGSSNGHPAGEDNHPPGATPQSTVVYVQQPPTAREAQSNTAVLAAVVVVGLMAAIGIILWNLGYLGGASHQTESTPPPTNITIHNPAQPPANNVIVPSTSPPQTAAPPAAPPAQQAQPAAAPTPATPAPPPPVDVVAVSAQATDTSAAQWHYGYTVKLRNNTTTPQTVNLRIKFLDGQGYVVDDTLMNNVYVPANTEQDYQDYKLIDAVTAAKVKSVKAEMR